ncbi:MFS transporter [Melioribacter sp. OK-6-Me]|uniref:MFS transporter n=1 Tax=unclassified Melioribacter TaxID=2627329 RepID=UPI003ED8CD95
MKLCVNKNLRIIYAITLISVMGVASITPAFPDIAAYFNLSGKEIGLLIVFFTLPGVILTPILGILADRYGRKNVLVPSLLLFGFAGIACFFAGKFEYLLILRFIQGAGAASLGSLNVTLIGDLFKGSQRAAAMGYNASVLSIATSAYPLIGGLLASIRWSYVFILPAFAIPVAFIVITNLDSSETPHTQTLREYLSNALRTIKSLDAIILFSISLVTFILLYGSYLTYLPFLLNKTYKFNSAHIGTIMSIMSFTTAIVSSRLGKLSTILSYKKIMFISFLFYGTALITLSLSHTISLLILSIIIYGVGQGLNLPTIQTLLSSIAPFEYRAVFMSVNGMVLRAGQTIGPALMGIAFSLGELQAVFYAGAFLAFLALIPISLIKVNRV